MSVVSPWVMKRLRAVAHAVPALVPVILAAAVAGTVGATPPGKNGNIAFARYETSREPPAPSSRRAVTVGLHAR